MNFNLKFSAFPVSIMTLVYSIVKLAYKYNKCKYKINDTLPNNKLLNTIINLFSAMVDSILQAKSSKLFIYLFIQPRNR